jgi:hypothetical protein
MEELKYRVKKVLDLISEDPGSYAILDLDHQLFCSNVQL